MKIQITEQHIKKGKSNSRSCPVAIAVKESLSSDYRYISVGRSSIGFLKKIGEEGSISIFESHDLSLPEIAKDFIKVFDEGIAIIRLAEEPINAKDSRLQEEALKIRETLKPFEMELTIP